MKRTPLILLLGIAMALDAQAGLRFGLGSAVAHRSAQLIDRANGNQPPGQFKTGLTGSVTFTVAPIDLANVTFVQSLGNLNPPGHTFPTDHMYFYYNYVNTGITVNPIGNSNRRACDAGCPVYAIADGFLSSIQAGADTGSGVNQYKVTFTHTDTFSSYYDHMTTLAPAILAQAGTIIPSGAISTWIPVKAGQQVGTTGGVAGQNALDLGVNNLQINQPFISPAHYGESASGDSPLKYFAEPLRSTLYGMVTRTTPDYLGANEKDGIFCYDVPNAVSGNWIAQGADDNWMNPDAWAQQLSIGYDPVYASQIRITFGGKYGSQSFGLLGDWMVQPGALAPTNVTAATGAYGYQIYGWDPSFGTIQAGSPLGLFMVQLLDNHTLKVEYFAGSAAASLAFDSNAVIYVR